MKRVFLTVVALFALAATPAFAGNSASSKNMSQTSQMHQKMKTQKVWGTVISSSSNSLEIKARDGHDMTFMINSKTKAPSSFTKGETVEVKYWQNSNNQDVAAHIWQKKSMKKASSSTPSGSGY